MWGMCVKVVVSLCGFFSASTQLQLRAPHPATPSALCAQPATCPPCFPTTPLSSSTPTESKAPPVPTRQARSRRHPCRGATPPASALLASTSPPPRPLPTSPGPETRGPHRCQMRSRTRPPPTSTPGRWGAPAPGGTQTSSRFGRARSLPRHKFSHSGGMDQARQHSSPTLTWMSP